jgi:hypothetical protein
MGLPEPSTVSTASKSGPRSERSPVLALLMLDEPQRSSIVVEMYHWVPSSATISPCSLRASITIRAAPEYPKMSFEALRRSLNPMGGSAALAGPAWWRAGYR